MKILHISPAYEPAWHLGGVVRSVSQLCRGLAALGHEVTVFTTDSGGDRRMEVPLNRPMEVGGVEVTYFKSEFTPRFGYSRALRNACRNSVREFDIVHLTSLWWFPGLAAAWAARQQGKPYVVSTTGGLTRYSLLQKSWKKRLYLMLWENRNLEAAAALRFTSAWERQESQYLGLKVSSFLVPNSFELSGPIEVLRQWEARSKYGLPSEARVVSFLGRLHPVKALDFLIKAFAMNAETFRDAILLLAGPDNGMLNHLRILVSKMGLTGRVLFPGMVDPRRRDALFAATDVFALVSHHENFGNAAVEAMLAGVPVLLSEHVGICREVAADGAGVVVPLQVEAIAEALKRMLSDPEGLREMGRRAAESARRRYDIRVVAQMMATAYEDILTGRRSPGLGWSDAQ
jgi:glycosyltransferase involved in cell wall biosynthesis